MKKTNQLAKQLEANRENALRLAAAEIVASREEMSVSEQWSETLNFEAPASWSAPDTPSVSVKDVSPGW